MRTINCSNWSHFHPDLRMKLPKKKKKEKNRILKKNPKKWSLTSRNQRN